jgi:phosphatidylinositol alpha-1,6-mannosyltransferase
MAGGIEDIVVHGETGFVLRERVPEVLAAHAALLLRRPELARKMGEKGRERVRVLFSKERSGNILLDIYRELALSV